jgi:hypothetical protein
MPPNCETKGFDSVGRSWPVIYSLSDTLIGVKRLATLVFGQLNCRSLAD